MRFGRARITEASWEVIVRELLVTTIGVLIALALNSWWSVRQDHKREHVYLVQLIADVDRSLAPSNLPSAITVEERATRATVQLLRAYRLPTPPPADSIARWLFDAETFSAYTPLTGTARALLTTSDIGLIRNDSVRTLIVAMVAGIDDFAARTHDHALRWQAESAELEQYTDYIALRARVLGPAVSDSTARSDSSYPIAPGPHREPFPVTDYQALLNNRGVYRALVKMNTAHRNTLDILHTELSGLRAVRTVFAAAAS